MLTDIDWTRKSRTYDISGDYTDNPEIVMSDPMYASTGDAYFQVETVDDVDTGLSKPYTYLWRRELVEISADGDELGSRTWEVEMTQTVSGSTWQERINGGAFYPLESPGAGTIATFTWTFNFTGYQPGTYEFQGNFSVNGGTLSTEQVIGKFDLRAVAIAHTGPLLPFDPQEEELPIELAARITTLPSPGTGRVFSDGWSPEAPLTWRVSGSSFSANEAHISDTGTETPAEQVDVTSEWDGRNLDGDYATESISLAWKVISAVPSSNPDEGNYYAKDNSSMLVYHRRCECDPLTGECKCVIELSTGGPVPLRLEYLSFYGHQSAASMGSGWRLLGSAKLKQAASGDLIYTSESGHVLRWHEGTGGVYTPAREDNYVTAETGGTSAFRLTFKGQSFRDFDSSGRLVADIDRIGNTLSYAYNMDGHLESVTDGRERYFYFDYGSRTDGQPEEIRVDDPVTGRLIQLEYDSENRLERVTDAAGEVTELEYNSLGLLSKETRVRPTLGDLVIEHHYAGRWLASEQLPGDVARVYSGDHLWVGPIVGGVIQDEDCGRTLDMARDPFGNPVYREENKPSSLYD
jgi:YD repeat-containing protein